MCMRLENRVEGWNVIMMSNIQKGLVGTIKPNITVTCTITNDFTGTYP